MSIEGIVSQGVEVGGEGDPLSAVPCQEPVTLLSLYLRPHVSLLATPMDLRLQLALPQR